MHACLSDSYGKQYRNRIVMLNLLWFYVNKRNERENWEEREVLLD